MIPKKHLGYEKERKEDPNMKRLDIFKRGIPCTASGPAISNPNVLLMASWKNGGWGNWSNSTASWKNDSSVRWSNSTASWKNSGGWSNSSSGK